MNDFVYQTNCYFENKILELVLEYLKDYFRVIMILTPPRNLMLVKIKANPLFTPQTIIHQT